MTTEVEFETAPTAAPLAPSDLYSFVLLDAATGKLDVDKVPGGLSSGVLTQLYTSAGIQYGVYQATGQLVMLSGAAIAAGVEINHDAFGRAIPRAGAALPQGRCILGCAAAGLSVVVEVFAALAPSTGGGPPTGPVDALAFYDGGGLLSGDALLTALPVDQFGRPQILDLRVGAVPATQGAVFRQGAWVADGDPSNVTGQGLVIYGPAPNGLQDAANGTIGRVKFDRFQIRMVVLGVDIGSAWRVDPTHMFFHDDLGATTMDVVRATGLATFVGGLRIAPASSLDVSAAGTLELGTANATAVAMGGAVGSTGSPRLLLNQGGTALHGSNAGIQVASAIANRGAIRVNQYGNNSGVPGITGFKSRGLTVGDLVSVSVDDVLWRATGIGVCDDDVSIPLAGMISLNAEFVATGYVACRFAVQAVPADGPNFGARREVFAVTSQGIPQLQENTNRGAGLVTLGADGSFTVLNTNADGIESRYTLTVQEGTGFVPAGRIYISAHVDGVSFRIKSTAGGADQGVVVYWQMWGACAPGAISP